MTPPLETDDLHCCCLLKRLPLDCSRSRLWIGHFGLVALLQIRNHTKDVHTGDVHIGDFHTGDVHNGDVHNGDVHNGNVHTGDVHTGDAHTGDFH
nr:hypothetical protein BgiMline_020859 [Biomphalaria glabrata]